MSLGRRKRSYWEPIYDPTLGDEPFPEGLWDFDNQRGPRRYVYRPEAARSDTKVVPDVVFSEVDFEGEFKYRIIFKGCTFDKCDFALSTFHRSKFTKCIFKDTTFSLCTLYDCEFRDCSFDRIGFSGNETILEKTLITNPSDFISGGKTNLAFLPPEKTSFEQKQRFEITKSTIARSLMSTLASEGSEKTYYDGVKISTIQDCKAKMATSLLNLTSACTRPNISFLKRVWKCCLGAFGVLGSVVDLGILRSFGLINAWGSSVTRPVLVGFFLISIFGSYYSLDKNISILDGLEKASEILLLFGYTKHSVLDTPDDIQVSQFLNAIFGVVWYVVTIPTIVNKLTRVRG